MGVSGLVVNGQADLGLGIGGVDAVRPLPQIIDSSLPPPPKRDKNKKDKNKKELGVLIRRQMVAALRGAQEARDQGQGQGWEQLRTPM